jgi:hypothetical protein
LIVGVIGVPVFADGPMLIGFLEDDRDLWMARERGEKNGSR